MCTSRQQMTEFYNQQISARGLVCFLADFVTTRRSCPAPVSSCLASQKSRLNLSTGSR